MCSWITVARVAAVVFVFFIGIHYGRRDGTGTLQTARPSPSCGKSVGEVITIIDPCPDSTREASAIAAHHDQSRPLLLHKNDVSPERKGNSVLKQVFGSLHHPETPVKAEVVLSQMTPRESLDEYTSGEDGQQTRIVPLNLTTPFSNCAEVYLTRSGSRESMPNKCVAVVRVPAHQTSATHLSHRYGVQAKMVDRYVGDWATEKELNDEAVLLPQILKHLPELIRQFTDLMGAPFDVNSTSSSSNKDQDRRAGIDTGSVVIFVGERENAQLIQSLGAKAFYSPHLGVIPRKAADSYGDIVFARLMWMKSTSVYIGAAAGFNVLFQDVDLVWLRDPFPFLQSHVTDIAFQDDGARTTRFTPFFVNSGFYFIKFNARTQYLMERMLRCAAEISSTHSHQATLTRYLTEVHSTFQLDIAVLPELLFPSGAQWHNNKKFIKEMLDYKARPYVFHMCWTASRDDKVTYLSALGLWLLPKEATSHCEVAKEMMAYSEKTNDVAGACCQIGSYFSSMPPMSAG